MAYILDADWAIGAIGGRSRAVGALATLAPARIAICWATVGEIYEGAFGFTDFKKRLDNFREFLDPMPKLDLNDDIMVRFAQIRNDLRRRGLIISDFDILLAATALHHNLTILTFNIRHFSRIPGVKIYPHP